MEINVQNFFPSPLPRPQQLMKVGFDDETSQLDMKSLEQHIVELRNPSTITLGVKILAPSTPAPDTLLSSPEREGPSLALHSTGRQQFRNKNKNESRNKGN